ncbi:vitelline membrane protein Vm26Ab [Zeugodacus cucurbitae]|nr:vitelline membrane protein Vm26Ab [Zeugodacus cucurbitae]
MIKFMFLIFTLSPIIAQIIQLEPSQGILIPAPLAQSVRISRSSYSPPSPPAAYGGGSASSYTKPAPAPVQSYKPSSIPAPPCPRNYLFSCQPSLAPAPCAAPVPSPSYSAPAPAAPSASYGSPQGAYSHIIPQYSFAVPVVKELF